MDEVDTAPPENMHKWRMVIAYDGTKFKGSLFISSLASALCLRFVDSVSSFYRFKALWYRLGTIPRHFRENLNFILALLMQVC